jgi:hypothetical protein
MGPGALARPSGFWTVTATEPAPPPLAGDLTVMVAGLFTVTSAGGTCTVPKKTLDSAAGSNPLPVTMTWSPPLDSPDVGERLESSGVGAVV